MAGKGKTRSDKHKARAQEMKSMKTMRSVDPNRNANPGGISLPGSAANRRLLTVNPNKKKQTQGRRTRFGL